MLPVTAMHSDLRGAASRPTPIYGESMKQRAFSAMGVAAFAIALAAMIPTAPVVHADTDVETACASSGGQYTSETVQPHFGADSTLIETCCTGGPSGHCVTYRDGVQGATYGGS
jgi:hypothetical protein